MAVVMAMAMAVVMAMAMAMGPRKGGMGREAGWMWCDWIR